MPSSLMRRMMLKISLTSSGARPSDGSSSMIMSGRLMSAAAHGQHLLLAAGERAALLPVAFLQAGEQGMTRSMSSLMPSLSVRE